MAQLNGVCINGYKFSKSHSSKRVFIAKTAEFLLNNPGLSKKEFLIKAYEYSYGKEYPGSGDPFGISRSHCRSSPGNKIWDFKLIGNKYHVYPNESTKLVVEHLPKWEELEKKHKEKISKIYEPYHTDLKVNDLVRYTRKIPKYDHYKSLFFGFTRVEDILSLESRWHVEYIDTKGGLYYPYDFKSGDTGRLPVYINPLDLTIWPKKCLFSKEHPNWRTKGSKNIDFTDSIVLDVLNITDNDITKCDKPVRKRIACHWSWIKILPLNGETPCWVVAWGWKKQDRKRRANKTE